MGALLRWLTLPLMAPVLKPLLRIVIGMLAIPLFRLLLRRVLRVQEMNEELERDLEQWFRASVVLLAATRNAEEFVFGWIMPINIELDALILGARLLMVIGVIEAMPDQALFGILHPGLRLPTWNPKLSRWKNCTCGARELVRGVICQHLQRSSPMFAILSAIFDGTTGWICFGAAVVQYLIIGLVTTRDKALDVLARFDAEVARQRGELLAELPTPAREMAPPAFSPAGNPPPGNHATVDLAHGTLTNSELSNSAPASVTSCAAENAENAGQIVVTPPRTCPACSQPIAAMASAPPTAASRSVPPPVLP